MTRRGSVRKNGFLYKPHDLFPVKLAGGKIVPARWYDASKGRAVLTRMSPVANDVWEVGLLLDGEPTVGWFHNSGNLWVDDQTDPRPEWARSNGKGDIYSVQQSTQMIITKGTDARNTFKVVFKGSYADCQAYKDRNQK